MADLMAIQGSDKVLAELKRLKKECPLATKDALREDLFELEAASVPLVPVATGRLRNARTVVVRGIIDPEALLSYNTAYAVYVHERLDLRHPVGEAKFLEKPFKRRAKNFPLRMVRRIQRRTKIK
jgi:hypothetical protein|tara:strand:- start:3669 stop:4043 length:375 start_codon:yes stop_codon:yes gene_type:complete